MLSEHLVSFSFVQLALGMHGVFLLFTLQDIVVIFLCLAGLGAGGVLGAIAANSWTTDFIDSVPLSLRSLIDVLVQTRDSLAATAVSLWYITLLQMCVNVVR